MQSPYKSCRGGAQERAAYPDSYEGDKYNQLQSSATAWGSASQVGKGSYYWQEGNRAFDATQSRLSNSDFSASQRTTTATGVYAASKLSKIDYFIAMEAYKAKNFEIYQKRSDELTLFQAREKVKMLEHDLATYKERNAVLEQQVKDLSDKLAYERQTRATAQSDYRSSQFDIAQYKSMSDAGQRQVKLLRMQLLEQRYTYSRGVEQLLQSIREKDNLGEALRKMEDYCLLMAASLGGTQAQQTLTEQQSVYSIESNGKIELSGYFKSREEISYDERIVE